MGALPAGLDALAVRCVFGLPGTQSVGLFEDLRKSPIRTVVPTSELAASFMAVGYARACGEVGVLATIPGPGFAYALPGLAEARMDSVPLLHIVVQEPQGPGSRFRRQEIEHLEIVRPLAKMIVEVDTPGGLPDALARSWQAALSGEPGPVVLWVSSKALAGKKEGDFNCASAPFQPGSGRLHGAFEDLDSGGGMAELAYLIATSRRPVLFLGLGSVGAAHQLREFTETLGAPFFTTPSARGIIPEDHPLCLEFDPDRGGLEVLNDLMAQSDLVLSLGCKLGHNGTGGFRLSFPEGRLVHVNSDPAALGANFPTLLSISATVETVVGALLASSESGGKPSDWSPEEVAEWRSRIGAVEVGPPPEPRFAGVPSGSVKELLENLREELPRDAIVVTDSGLHQVLVRRYLQVLAPRGLILPTDFQSMGFGLPAAVGAALAAPHRKVVAVIGDGGLAMSGMEFLSLAREGLPVTVFVFNDGHLNLIRLQQERDFGVSHGVQLRNPEMEAFAEAVGAEYFRLDDDVRVRVKAALDCPGPALVDVPLGDSPEIRTVRRNARAKRLVREALGEGLVDRIKRLVKRE